MILSAPASLRLRCRLSVGLLLLAAGPAFATVKPAAAIPTPPPLPSASNQPNDVPFVFPKPSDEMDFAIKPVPQASFGADPANPIPTSANGVIPAPPPLQPLTPGTTTTTTTTTTTPATNADGKPFDQFFSTTTVLPEETQTEEVVVTETRKDGTQKKTKKKIVRRGPKWGRAGAPFPGFHSVRLPEPIYSKQYSRPNLGLPVAVWESDIQSLLAIAVVRGRTEDMRALVRSGADLNETTEGGESLVSLGTRYRQADSVRWLLQHGANPNTIDGTGVGPLSYAAYDNDHTIANLLLRYGADQNTIDIRGTSALAAAESRGAENAAIVLRRNGG